MICAAPAAIHLLNSNKKQPKQVHISVSETNGMSFNEKVLRTFEKELKALQDREEINNILQEIIKNY